MNLFVLLAAPVAAVLFQRLFHREFTLAADLRAWLPGLVWSVLLATLTLILWPMTVFQGDVATTLLAQTVVSSLLVPGVPLFVHTYPPTAPRLRDQRPESRAFALAFTLALCFAFLGLGAFLSADRQSDAWDLFLLPLWRLALLAWLPWMARRLWTARAGLPFGLWCAALASASLVQPVLALLWYAGWGLVVAVVVVGVCASVALLWPRAKKTVPLAEDGSLAVEQATGEDRPEQP